MELVNLTEFIVKQIYYVYKKFAILPYIYK